MATGFPGRRGDRGVRPARPTVERTASATRTLHLLDELRLSLSRLDDWAALLRSQP